MEARGHGSDPILQHAVSVLGSETDNISPQQGQKNPASVLPTQAEKLQEPRAEASSPPCAKSKLFGNPSANATSPTFTSSQTKGPLRAKSRLFGNPSANATSATFTSPKTRGPTALSLDALLNGSSNRLSSRSRSVGQQDANTRVASLFPSKPLIARDLSLKAINLINSQPDGQEAGSQVANCQESKLLLVRLDQLQADHRLSLQGDLSRPTKGSPAKDTLASLSQDTNKVASALLGSDVHAKNLGHDVEKSQQLGDNGKGTPRLKEIITRESTKALSKRRRKTELDDPEEARGIKRQKLRGLEFIIKSSRTLPSIGSVRGHHFAKVFPEIYKNGNVNFKVSEQSLRDLKAKGYEGATPRRQITTDKINFLAEFDIGAASTKEQITNTILLWLEEKNLVERHLPPPSDNREGMDPSRYSFSRESSLSSLISSASRGSTDEAEEEQISPSQGRNGIHGGVPSPNTEQPTPIEKIINSKASDEKADLVAAIRARWNMTEAEFDKQIGAEQRHDVRSLGLLAAVAHNMTKQFGLSILKHCRDQRTKDTSDSRSLDATKNLVTFEKIVTTLDKEMDNRTVRPLHDISLGSLVAEAALGSSWKRSCRGVTCSVSSTIASRSDVLNKGENGLDKNLQKRESQPGEKTIPEKTMKVEQKLGAAVIMLEQTLETLRRGHHQEMFNLTTDNDIQKEYIEYLETRNNQLIALTDKSTTNLERLQSENERLRADACDHDIELRALKEEIQSLRDQDQQRGQAPTSASHTLRKNQERAEAPMNTSITPLEGPVSHVEKRIIKGQEYSVVTSGPNAGKLVSTDFQLVKYDDRRYLEHTVLFELKLDLGPVEETPVRVENQCYYRVIGGSNAGRLVRSLESPKSLYMPNGREGETYVRWTFLVQPRMPRL